jgi:HD-GYP domain-containing protein (c-di-GMP phosphodiesterase class II)
MERERSSVERRLMVRIGLVAAVAAVVFGIVAWVTERGRIADSIADRAVVAASRFNGQIQSLLDATGGIDADAMQRQLDAYVGPGVVPDRYGTYVAATVYGVDGSLVARFEDAEHHAIRSVRSRMADTGHDPSDAGGSDVSFVKLGGRPHAHVALPLRNSEGVAVAQLEGVFAVSDAGIASTRWNALRGVGMVLVIVLGTAGVLYPVILQLVRRLERVTVHLLDANLEILSVLGGAVAKRDNDTEAHNYRVTIYAVCLAEVIGLSDDEIRSLIKGGLLHDVGKIAIQDAVLLKPGKLDEAEYEVMKTHVEHGLDITGRSSWLEDGAPVVGGHHEKFGGGGYPQGLKGHEIPVTARIFAVVDVFDALTSRRPYKEPLSLEDTMALLENGRGSHFDPRMLDAFSGIARELHAEFAGADVARARRELDQMTHRYFHAALEELVADRPAAERPVEVDSPPRGTA